MSNLFSSERCDLVSSGFSSSLYLLLTSCLLSRLCGFQVSLRSMYKPRYFATFATGRGMLLRNTGGLEVLRVNFPTSVLWDNSSITEHISTKLGGNEIQTILQQCIVFAFNHGRRKHIFLFHVSFERYIS
jgi:hypothetical protein